MTFRRDLHLRLAKVESAVSNTPEELRRLMELDRPLLAGSPEHLAAIARGVDLSDRMIMDLPDEPIPKRPVL